MDEQHRPLSNVLFDSKRIVRFVVGTSILVLAIVIMLVWCQWETAPTNVRRLGGTVTRNWLGQIVGVTLDNASVSDEDLAVLSLYVHIKYLSLRHAVLDDNSLSHLSRLPKLAELDLEGSSITDKALDHIARLQRLRVLAVADTAISDASVPNLVSLRTLRFLFMFRSRVSDEARRDILDRSEDLIQVDNLVRTSRRH